MGSLFEMVREKGIKVCTICPGMVATDMVSKFSKNEDKMIQSNDIAEAVAFVVKVMFLFIYCYILGIHFYVSSQRMLVLPK